MEAEGGEPCVDTETFGGPRTAAQTAWPPPLAEDVPLRGSSEVHELNATTEERGEGPSEIQTLTPMSPTEESTVTESHVGAVRPSVESKDAGTNTVSLPMDVPLKVPSKEAVERRAHFNLDTGRDFESRGGSKRTTQLETGARDSTWKPSDGPRVSTMSGIDQYDRPRRSTTSVKKLRTHLKESLWYNGKTAQHIRRFLFGKTFALAMVVALFAALFLPDIWIIAGVNSNVAIDVVLTLVFILFAAELVLLSVVDANYLLSFFFAMDVVGTFSMAFDISYMLGESATEPKISGDDEEAQGRFMLLRAARAAKVGARAGRLSRVLRMLRFIPFLARYRQNEEGQVGIASMISGQLANLLATRVACLTIILVMVIPLFEVWHFPQHDHSLETWAERIAVQLRRDKVESIRKELDLMVAFFNRQTYGPYGACIGALGSSTFHCAADSEQPAVLTAWTPGFSAPPMGKSAFLVTASDKSFAVSFNMHHPAALEAGLSMATILFIIFIMVFSGLALSSVVMKLAVRPLERMLKTVRQIASTVFKCTAEVEDQEEDNFEIDCSNEINLLEKVVEKLALVADLQIRKTIVISNDMRDEDIGIISLMQGGKDAPQGIVAQSPRAALRKTVSKRISDGGLQVRLEDFGLTQESYNSWSFNALLLTKAQRCSVCVYAVARFSDSGEGFITNMEDKARLQSFVTAVEKEYMPNPYHNFAHAVDTVHGVSKMMRLMNADAFLTELDQFSVLVSAVAHDLGHPGVNNGFLSEVGHDLAMQYNDKSPLENMHCAKLYTIVAVQETNVFAKLTKEQYKEARKVCIEMILHTDMMGHQAMIKDLQMAYQMHAEVFQVPPDPTGVTPAELEVFAQNSTKMLAMNCILHSADVSNPCRAWGVTQDWADRCLEEFFAQGDQEKMLGIPVQFLNDRDKLNRPNSQIGFIEFMIAPFYVAQIRLWPRIGGYGDNLANNIETWEEMWVEEVSPGEEEKQKVRARVDKVRRSVEDAKARNQV